MGIRGLMSFVEDHSNEFFTDLKLRDTKLIIDGYALFHRLCFNSDLELRCGGDYDSFAEVVQKFFESLFACDICPYVVLDGGCDISDKKLTTLKDRAREKIQAAHALSTGGGGCVCPLLAREVFIQVLVRLRVQFVQCFSEADRDIMTLANHWGCPVLSSDSDFCVFDLKTGFCPFDGFQWRSPATAGGARSYLPARCFSLDAFCRRFGNMDRALLPLFAVLCGNDHVCLPVVETFLSKACLPLGAAARRGRHRRVLGLLNWLSRFADAAAALEQVLEHLPEKGREQVRELLCRSMEEYQQSPVRLQDFFRDGACVCPDALGQALPPWVRVALARGQLSPFVSDALLLRRTLLHTQVEDLQRPSAHRAAQPIRQVLYGLLSGASPHPERASWSTSPPQPRAFREVERVGKSIRTAVVDAAKLPEDCSDLSSLAELPPGRRQRLLLEALRVKPEVLEPVPATLKLPVAVSCYWLQQADVRVQLRHLQALLLGMLAGAPHAGSSPGTAELREGGTRTLKDVLQRVRAQRGARLDLDAAHAFSQWQCCLQMGVYLNQLLGNPLPEPELAGLYSGSLVHGLCQQLRAPGAVESLLSVCPEAERLYKQLLDATRPYAPAELFLPKGKSNSKKKRRKKQNTSCGQNWAGRASRPRLWHEGGNRFGPLMAASLQGHPEASDLEPAQVASDETRL
ncbi:protein asteroid homolog 1 [Carlito syrichta]|uniref:Protein asteroid homolog 1 n=1 Tax=Carlito syrichta TaxID=1868482 RepID=A0A1U7V170_CARSF|nr:protein asteroid homolog 1 [Carlito syrichta]